MRKLYYFIFRREMTIYVWVENLFESVSVELSAKARWSFSQHSQSPYQFKSSAFHHNTEATLFNQI